jgi:hypothetical protein
VRVRALRRVAPVYAGCTGPRPSVATASQVQIRSGLRAGPTGPFFKLSSVRLQRRTRAPSCCEAAVGCGGLVCLGRRASRRLWASPCQAPWRRFLSAGAASAPGATEDNLSGAAAGPPLGTLSGSRFNGAHAACRRESAACAVLHHTVHAGPTALPFGRANSAKNEVYTEAQSPSRTELKKGPVGPALSPLRIWTWDAVATEGRGPVQPA